MSTRTPFRRGEGRGTPGSSHRAAPGAVGTQGSPATAPEPAESTTTPPTRHRTQLFRVAPAVVAALGVFALVASRDLEVGDIADPGPGLWPVAVSTLAVVTGLLLVWRDLPVDYESWSRRACLVLVGVVVLGVFIALFESLGFLVATFITLAIWLKGLAGEKLWVSLALALVGAVALDVVFESFFGVPFPPGFVRLGGA